jgi:transcriptional/translational regulatory protein YebC/TACO1
MVELSGEEEEKVLKLIAKMEEEEDVQRVFHNLA